MKTSDFNVASALAKITGKPVGEFYNEAIRDEIESSNEISADPIKIRYTEKTEKTPTIKTETSNQELKEIHAKFGGEIVNNKILSGRQMTRAEYLKIKKQLKTPKDLWNSPYLYLMFRAEGQHISSFVDWTTHMEKELEDGKE